MMHTSLEKYDAVMNLLSLKCKKVLCLNLFELHTYKKKDKSPDTKHMNV